MEEETEELVSTRIAACCSVEKKYIYRRGGRGFDLGRFNGR
jgi:hypothetical protein